MAFKNYGNGKNGARLMIVVALILLFMVIMMTECKDDEQQKEIDNKSKDKG